MKYRFNIYEKRTVTEVVYGINKLKFFTDAITIRLAKTELYKEDKFDILNEYIKFACMEEELFSQLQRLNDSIYQAKPISEIETLVIDLINSFDQEMLDKFVSTRKFNHPTSIKDIMDNDRADNYLVTNDQTYLVSEYFELLKLVIIIKAVAPVIGMVIKFYHHHFLENLELFSVLKFITRSNIGEMDAFDKLKRFIDKHIQSVVSSESQLVIKAMKLNITVDDIPRVILSNILFRKIFTTSIEKTPGQRSIINEMYGTIKSVINNNGNLKDNINFKRPSPATDDDSGEEAYLDSSRRPSEIEIGNIAYYNLIARDVDRLIYDLQIKDKELVYELINIAQILVLENKPINKDSRLLAKWVLNDILPIRAEKYVDRQYIPNLLAVAYVKIRELGFPELANFCLVRENPDETPVEATVTMSWVKAELKEELEEIFQVNKEVSKQGNVVTEETVLNIIKEFTDRLQTYNNVFLAPSEYIPSKNREAIVYSDIRNDLASLLIKINREE